MASQDQGGKTTGGGATTPGVGGMYPGDHAPPGTPGTGEDICPECRGKGRLQSGAECPNCGGSGKVVQGIAGG